MVFSEEAQLSSLSHGLQKFSVLTRYGQRIVAPNHHTQFSASDCIMMLATCIPLSHHSQKVSPIQQLIPYNQRNITLNLIYLAWFSTSDCIIMTSATCIPLFHYLQKAPLMRQLTPCSQRIVTPIIYHTRFSASSCIVTTSGTPFNCISLNAIMTLCMKLAFGGIGGNIPNCVWDLLPEVMHFTNLWVVLHRHLGGPL